jgi:apolipoprotein N-acyltransferase
MTRACLLICATPILLTLAATPGGLWPLAWIALVPWLLVIGESKTTFAAMFRGWMAGAIFFGLNTWWLWTANIAGTVAFSFYFGVYWGIAAAVLHRTRWLNGSEPARSAGEAVAAPGAAAMACRVVGIAAVWVALEWVRCYVISGFPWVPVGSTQLPWLAMCQVADLGGPWILSFWVMLINALAALAWIWRRDLQPLRLSAAIVATTLLLTGGYGYYRLATTVTTPGPRVMALQSNFPHLQGGTPTAAPEQVVEYFIGELEQRLEQEPVDLVVLPEAAFPPINAEARTELANGPKGRFLQSTHDRLLKISQDRRVGILVGGNAVTNWVQEGAARVGREIRNSAYYYDGDETTDVARYDKTELVPFSERSPFAWAPAWVQKIGRAVSAKRIVQPLTPGSRDDLRPFELSWRKESPSPAGAPEGPMQTALFIAPICLENIDPAVIARMIRPAPGGKKEIDFIANLSNDGWFANQEKYEHMQLSALRCIENRVPMVRSSNTGISGWIDTTGRIRDTIAPNTSGVLTARVELDDRIAFYTRFGDVFVAICFGLAILAVFVQPRLTRHVRPADE